MNGLNDAPWQTVFALQRLSSTLLYAAPADKVFQLAGEVRALVARVKAHEPERVPMRDQPGGLLLGAKRVPRDDFAIAESLISSEQHIASKSGAQSLLAAYVAVESLNPQVDNEWANSALAYLVSQVSVEAALSAAWQEALRRHVVRLSPLAAKGETFSRHSRPKGSIGPLGRAIDRHLGRNRQASALEVWNALAKKPPRGMSFFDNREGRYIEHASHRGVLRPPTSYRRFQNAVTESRQRLGITEKRTVNRSQ